MSAGSDPDVIRMLTNEQLVSAAKCGCTDCFSELVDRCAAGLLAFMQHKVGTIEDAEDLVQDTFVRAYVKLHQFDGRHKFTTWLYAIGRNLAASRSRKPALNLRMTAEAARHYPAPDDILEQIQLRSNLWSVAKKLPSNQYEALWLRYAQDMSIREISHVMDKTQVHVKVLLYRARAAMAKKLQKRPAGTANAEAPLSKRRSGFPERSGA
ncbi:MAG: sigma-70 family RNA polymerase sigma factor [Phycisphaerae bacterium]|nr:sigma-70 family RNA polymerase sigma factor [Phycisphaerae bacterium]